MSEVKPLTAPERPPVPNQPRGFAFSPPWHAEQSTLRNWHTLPRELQDSILDLAVHLRPTRPHYPWRHEDTSRLGIDMPTALNIALVSRDYQRRIEVHMYQRIRLSRPSALLALQATLATRRNLGFLLEALNVGPTDRSTADPSPIRDYTPLGGSPCKLLSTSLQNHPLRPEWCCPRHEFFLPSTHEEAKKDGRTRNVTLAIESACLALDINPHRKGYDQAGRSIGGSAWDGRLFEVQAAAELYLIEMGRREQANDDKFGLRTSYPRLVVMDKPSTVAASEDVLRLSRSQLNDHICRSYSKTDHFDHPVVLARSSMESSGAESVQRSNSLVLKQQEGQDIAAHEVSCDPLFVPLPPTATNGGILELVRSVLALTPNVRSLSFNSYLERVVCGPRAPTHLPALKSLTMGPPTKGYKHRLKLEGSVISSLERLRLAGHLLNKDTVASVVGDNGMLRQLKSFQYSSSVKYPRGEEEGQPWGIIDIVKRLCGLDPTKTKKINVPPSNWSALSRKRPHESVEEEEEVQPVLPTRRSHPLYIELRLHPEDAKAVLAAAPTAKMREAWRTGKPMPGSAVGNRLQIFISRGFDDSQFAQWAELKSGWILQEEAEEWWDEGLRPLKGGEGDGLGEAEAAAG